MRRRQLRSRVTKDMVITISDDSTEDEMQEEKQIFEGSGIHHSRSLFGNENAESDSSDSDDYVLSEILSLKKLKKLKHKKCDPVTYSKAEVNHSMYSNMSSKCSFAKFKTFKTYGKCKWKTRKLSTEWESAISNGNVKNSAFDSINGSDLCINTPVQAEKSLSREAALLSSRRSGINIGSPSIHSTPMAQSGAARKTPGRRTKDGSYLNDSISFHRTIAYSPVRSELAKSFVDKKTSMLSSLSLLKHDTILSDVKDFQEVATVLPIKDKILNICEQEQVMDMSDYVKDKSYSFIGKVAEGSYGEVFEKKNKLDESIIVKIVPVGCPEVLVNGIPQMTLEEIMSEMVINKTLSEVKTITNDNFCFKTAGFIRLVNLRLCQGKYPRKLLKLWKAWDDSHTSENDNPEMLESDQMFIIFELDNCGIDLEHYNVVTQAVSLSILKQIIASLAAAEQLYQFEHRDLHWGNILIMSTSEPLIEFVIAGEKYSFESHGVLVSIIDFTLSRIQGDGCVVYTDLCDEVDLFCGKGDIQFKVYQDMKEYNCNDWETFNPYTNILWIHYIARKLSLKNKKRPFYHLKTFIRDALNYESAYEMLTSCEIMAG